MIGTRVEFVRGVSRRARVLAFVLRLLVRPILRRLPLSPRTWWLITASERAAAAFPPPRGTTVEAVEFGPCPAEWVRAAGVADRGDAILYFHGGAFLFGNLGTHRRLAAALSGESASPVLSVAYRQLPHHDLATSVDDCAAAYQWLLAQGFSASRIVIVGDSAGGHLALKTAMNATLIGLPGPAGIAAVSPWVDFDAGPKERHENARCDAYIPVSRMAEVAKRCADDLPVTPEMSPINGAFHGLPPVLIQVGSTEVLLHDADQLWERLTKAGVPCRLQVWEGQVHAFPVFVGLVPEAAAAVAEIGAFAQAALTTSTRIAI